MTHLLIIGGGSDLPPRARAALPGLRTSVICRQEVVSHLQDPERIDRLVVLPANAPAAEWIAAAEYVNRCDPIDRITNYTERDTDKTAIIASVLGLAAASTETHRLITDKVAMRRRLRETGVDDTLASVISTREDVREFAETAGYPLICKPASGVGSRGISRINGPTDVQPALAHASTSASTMDRPELMIEQFHTGIEYSVEGFSENSQHLIACITLKYSDPASFVELGHVLPAPIDSDLTKAIEYTVEQALDVLGITDGVTHTEVIVTEDRVRIVETHLRPAGDQIPYLLTAASGMDLIDALARQSVGLAAIADLRVHHEHFTRQPRYAAIRYANPDLAGEILSVSGQDAAWAVPGVCEVVVLRGPGAELTRLSSSASRPAYAWAIGDSPEQALDRATKAVELLEFAVAGSA